MAHAHYIMEYGPQRTEEGTNNISATVTAYLTLQTSEQTCVYAGLGRVGLQEIEREGVTRGCTGWLIEYRRCGSAAPRDGAEEAGGLCGGEEGEVSPSLPS